MTNEDWKQVEENWGYIRITLQVDNYKLDIVPERSKMKIYNMVYVNGKFEGIDLITITKQDYQTEPKWSELATRFYQTRKKSLRPEKEIKKLEKLFGKKKAKELGFNKRTHFYKQPWWTSFKLFKLHLIKYNKDIKLIKTIS